MDEDALKQKYVGQSLLDVAPLPAAVLDLAKLEVNCQRMIDATNRLGLLWRPHVKTHKTVQLTRLQVGDVDDIPVNIVISTVPEATHLLPLTEEYQGRGRPVNILYSFPFHAAAIPGLANISKALGPNSLTLMIDHPSQLANLPAFLETGAHKPLIFIKIDTGYHRAGVLPDSPACTELLTSVLSSEREGHCTLHGLYSHASQAYSTCGTEEAISFLAHEFRELQLVVDAVGHEQLKSRAQPLVLSVGATPTATTIQQRGLMETTSAQDDPTAHEMSILLETLRKDGFALEVHAGVYPTLDMQQLATHARDASLMTSEHIAISVLAEVASLYPGRGEGGTTEALITAGSLALGREPVQGGKDYAYWGWVAPWNGLDNHVPGSGFPRVHGGWQVGRISQEHGILVWDGPKENEVPLRVGQKVRVWPNHACIAGAGASYYLIVDSRNEGREAEIVDVWTRVKGW